MISSELIIDTKVENAQKLLSYLYTFSEYHPPASNLSADELDTRIKNIKIQNIDTIEALKSYSSAVNDRQKLFQKNDDSLIKILSPIAATIRSFYGKTSKESVTITALVTKIRGVKVKKMVKEPNAKFVSQSERSYGSMTQNFSDIIVTLEKYGHNYNPANESIRLNKLKDKLTGLILANIKVTNTYERLKEKRDKRSHMYKELTNITQRIKDAVKSQYGLKSKEYSAIKGLRV